MLFPHLRVYTIFFIFISLHLVRGLPIDTNIKSPSEIQPRALSHWRKLAQHVKSTPNPVFWSGTHNGKSVKSAADKHAKAIGGSTIGHDLKAVGMKPPPRNDPSSKKWWELASRLKAQHSTGHASAVLGSTVNKDGVWKQIEEPELMKNDKVHTVSQIHPDTLKETEKLKSSSKSSSK